ncbi:MAG: thioredoxin [Pseudomonadota bacterium]|nr:thioredoxin [Pseudomonadota bacterium]MEC8461158.1 thioredoxin [Pseudomonadota bacterium]
MTRIHNVSSEADFDNLVQSNPQVLVDFWAPWCGPCKHLDPVLKEYVSQTEHKQLVLCKVNVDEVPTLASRYNVRGIPTLLMLVNGEQSGVIVGNVEKDRIERFVSEAIG